MVTDATEQEPSAASPATVEPDLLLPPGAVLVHIGPHKTGTTAIQNALLAATTDLAAHDVKYFGSRALRVDAVQAVRGVPPNGTDARGRREWQRMVRDARRAPTSRVVLSSEWFSEATPAAIAQIVADLGRERVHVVATLRPLTTILPSQWQQYVQGGVMLGYEEWLEGVLRHPERRVTPSFWLRHRHDNLLARWSSAVGSGRVTAIVADERDPAFVLRAFETMLGLPGQTLRLGDDRTNRSLTQPEIEVVRRLYGVLQEAGADGTLRQDLVLFGAAQAIKERTPSPAEPRVATPAWALDEASRLGLEIATEIESAGVRVVGDLARLRGRPETRPVAAEVSPEVWPEVAALAVRGALARAGVLPRRRSPSTPRDAGVRPARRWLGSVARRLRRFAVDRFARV